MLPQNCELCSSNPDLEELWGCDWSKQLAADIERIPDDEGIAHEYYHCPLLWISMDVALFIEKYRSIKNGFSSAIQFEKESAWFLAAKKYYEKWYHYCLSKKEVDITPGG